MNNLPKRKANRLKHYDYSSNDAYLGKIDVGSGVLDAPKMLLSDIGKNTEEQLHEMMSFYEI